MASKWLELKSIDPIAKIKKFSIEPFPQSLEING
jgi:hypothetical protein